ncbi:MAG: AAA family ATPase [Candidatus Omnitrophica bacterium]|nr:AAA family ATPase [Candidatus Omnitrophota bacterium]MDE2009300.1 AAA family ATPase [Candidatus Omnitrophota bacterium]MDE2213819.1 AAA family ATPase [Candidatus Omnitrophota bacterium]MDE2232329.1 AAA family ATPase [Candidatus Omnitrophota bacterium]
MMKSRFVKFIRVYWKGILLYAVCAGLVTFLLIFLYYGGTSFLGMEGFYRKNMMAQMGIYMLVFLFVGIVQAFFSAYIYMYFMMGGGMSKMLSKDSAEKGKTDVRWDDVIGLESAKRDAWEVVQFIKDSNKVKAMGGTMIKGILMVGPPGCGKTYLAKAIAYECKLPFLSAVGSEFVAIFVGMGAARIKSLFKKARQLAAVEGGCLIFIDEIDAFATPRVEETTGFGGGMSHNAAINQFLTELDGLRRRENNIVIIAATNMPPEKLDPAIMRSGRFDRKITVEKPTAREREELIRYYLKKIACDPAIDVALIAEKAQWFSPADIHNMVREASVLAMRERRSTTTQDDLLKAMNDVMANIEKTGEEKILSNKVNVKWDEVIGMTSAKEEAWELVDLLKDRNRVKSVGGKIVKGILLLGPPGCGKTYLAKAMATESGFPFVSAMGSDLVGVFVGEGAKKMKSIFKEARQLARAEGGCIIFFDEIDSFATHRVEERGYGGGISHNATINQFLTELDGLRQQENNIVIIAATNVSEDKLDPAVLRAGRIERKIYVNLPNLKERIDLFKFYLSKVKTDASVNSDMLGRKTLWFSPSDIDSMIREAGLIALRDKRDYVNNKDLSAAYDRILYGAKSNTILSDAEKEWVAYHESGHAIIGYMLHPTDDVIKATIIPRKGALGFVAPRPREEVHIQKKEWFLAQIKVVLASYAAETIKYGTTGSGVGGDFQTAMWFAHSMVWKYGMGKSGRLGNWDNLVMAYGQTFISEKTKEVLNDDVQSILQECLTEVTGILTQNRQLLDSFAQELLSKGELEYDEIEAIFQKFGIKPSSRPPILATP